MKVHGRDNRRTWFDPHLRLWTMVTVDSDENQIGFAQYDNRRSIVMKWLKTGAWK